MFRFSEGSDSKWSLIRTALWVKFIRRETVLPAPFNLIPSWLHVFNLCFSCLSGGKEVFCVGNKVDSDDCQKKRNEILKSLVKRCNQRVFEIL